MQGEAEGRRTVARGSRNHDATAAYRLAGRHAGGGRFRFSHLTDLSCSDHGDLRIHGARGTTRCASAWPGAAGVRWALHGPPHACSQVIPASICWCSPALPGCGSCPAPMGCGVGRCSGAARYGCPTPVPTLHAAGTEAGPAPTAAGLVELGQDRSAGGPQLRRSERCSAQQRFDRNRRSFHWRSSRAESAAGCPVRPAGRWDGRCRRPGGRAGGRPLAGAACDFRWCDEAAAQSLKISSNATNNRPGGWLRPCCSVATRRPNGAHNSLLNRVLRYGLVGGTAAAVHIGVLLLLSQLMSLSLANPIAFLAASVAAISAMPRWRSGRTGGRQFPVALLLQYLVNISVCALMPLFKAPTLALVLTPTLLNALIWSQAARFSALARQHR